MPVRARGWCSSHYMHWYRNGVPRAPEYIEADLPGEEWRPIPMRAYAELYEVSSHGRVKRIRASKGAIAGLILSLGHTRGGYRKALLHRGSRRHRDFFAHRLVALAFLPRPSAPELLDVNHLDGNPSNNHYSNLEWATRQENVRHSFDVLGKQVPIGEAHGMAKLTEADVLSIRADYARGGIGQRALGRRYGVSQNTIGRIIRRQNWTHI